MEQLQEVQTTPEEALKVDPLDNPEINKAANDFGNLVPRVRALSRNLGGKALSRVYVAVAEFPFNSTTPKFRTSAENELFVLTLHLLGLKAMMAKAVEDSKKEIEQKAIDGIVDEVLANKEAVNE